MTRGRFAKCSSAWCAECFTPSPLDPCVVKLPEDFVGADPEEVGEKERFMQARPGDHMCTSFQCPNCQSQNIRGKDLQLEFMADACFESLCIRAQLDAFWARAPNTVDSHVREVRFMARYGNALGISTMPPLGPFRLGQHNGMLQAILLEMRLMEKGRKKGQLTCMYGTARSIRSTSTVLWENSPFSGSDIAFSSGAVKGRFVATMCPSEGRWYEHFNRGCSVRMGDIVTQDRAYSIEVVLAMIEMFEEQFQAQGYSIPIRDMEAIMFFIASCFGGFRGYETVWTDLAALRYDVAYSEDLVDPDVAWPVTGRFKNEHGVWGHYYIPIAGVTGSGVRVFEWTQRFIRRLEMAGRFDGWAFRKADGKTRAKAHDYSDFIFSKLEHLQETTSLIDQLCDIRNDYGMQRSGRRFFDTECINQRVSKLDIEFQCRWSTDRANGDRSVHRSMVHTYAEIRNMKATLVRPSKTI